MIVTCEECSTRFNLDDAVVRDEGSKVRCSVCKYVFTVFPAPLELGVETDPSPETVEAGSDMPDTPADGLDDTLFDDEPAEFEMEDSDYSLEDTDLSLEAPSFDTEPGDDAAPDAMEIEVEEDFSLDHGELRMDDGDTLSLDTEDREEDFSLGLDDGPVEEDATLDFDDAEPEEFDGIEFEAIDDDTPAFEELPDDTAEFEEPPGDVPEFESGLELETADEGDTDSDAAGLEEDFSSEDDFELEFDVSDDEAAAEPLEPEEDTPDAEPAFEVEADGDDPAADLTFEADTEANAEADTDEEEPPVVEAEEDFSEYDEVLEQETEPDIEAPPEPEAPVLETDTPEPAIEEVASPDISAAPEASPPGQRRRKKRQPLIGTPVLVLILLFLLVAGAYIASLMTGYHIPFLSDIKVPVLEEMIRKPAKEAVEAKPVPNQKSVNGRFVTNTTAGTLFVITGTVDNPTQSAFSHIEVKGALIVKDKVESKTKTAYCGNIISEEMLKTGNITDINKQLAVREGRNNTNVNVKPGSSVPFMIVFSDLPDKLQNFTVKVTRFDRLQT